VLNAIWFTLGGMAIVFATLCALLVVMMGLGRVLKPRPQSRAGAASSPGPVGKT